MPKPTRLQDYAFTSRFLLREVWKLALRIGKTRMLTERIEHRRSRSRKSFRTLNRDFLGLAVPPEKESGRTFCLRIGMEKGRLVCKWWWYSLQPHARGEIHPKTEADIMFLEDALPQVMEELVKEYISARHCLTFAREQGFWTSRKPVNNRVALLATDVNEYFTEERIVAAGIDPRYNRFLLRHAAAWTWLMRDSTAKDHYDCDPGIANIRTIEEFANYGRAKIRALPYVGEKIVSRIEQVLRRDGIELAP